jgi:hypothetical protein
LRQHTYGKLSFSLSIQLLVPTEKRAFFDKYLVPPLSHSQPYFYYKTECIWEYNIMIDHQSLVGNTIYYVHYLSCIHSCLLVCILCVGWQKDFSHNIKLRIQKNVLLINNSKPAQLIKTFCRCSSCIVLIISQTPP